MSREACQTYKTAHQSIVDSIDQLMPLVRSYGRAKPKLRIFHQKLLNHFGRHNRAFFEKLEKHYAHNKEALKMLEFLLHDSKDIKVKFLTFMEKHSGEMEDINARTFPTDFQFFMRELIEYLKVEDEYLLPLLEDLP